MISSHHIIIGIVGHQSINQKINVSSVVALNKHLLYLRKKYGNIILIVPFSMELHLNIPIIKMLQEMNIPYTVLLPIKREAYEKSLSTDRVFDFQQICNGALHVYSVDLYPGISLETFFLYTIDKRYQNFACQRLICKQSKGMIALWDGVIDYKIGSVADAVRIRQKEFSLPIDIISVKSSNDDIL